MLDVITLVIIVIGGTYTIYYGVRFLLNLVLRREHKNWVTQNYRKHSGVNLSRVNKVVTSGALPVEELSHWEMVAVFGLLLLNPSCYQRKLILQASTKSATLISKPLGVTA